MLWCGDGYIVVDHGRSIRTFGSHDKPIWVGNWVGGFSAVWL